MKFIIDFDSTLVDSKKKVVELYFKKYNHYINNDDCVTWELSELTQSNPNEIKTFFSCKEFYEDLPKIDGMFELVRELYNLGHEIVICSYSEKEGIENKRSYLKENIPYAEHVLFEIGNDDSKLDKSSVIGDIIIDDNVYALESSPCTYKICFGDYLWNNTDKYTKVKNAKELREEIFKII